MPRYVMLARKKAGLKAPPDAEGYWTPPSLAAPEIMVRPVSVPARCATAVTHPDGPLSSVS